MEEKLLYIAKYSHEINGVGVIKKIGKTTNINGRMKNLTIGVVEVTPIVTYLGESSLIDKLETDLHNTLKEFKIKGEWFSDDDDIIIGFVENQVKKLKKLGFPIKKMKTY
jgi:hypothetical protein